MKINKKNGFSILAVILVIVAVIVAIGVWALSGQANTNDSSKSATIAASSIINESASIKLAFDKIIINGDATKQNVIYKPTVQDKANILDPTNGINLSNGGKGLIDSVSITNYVYDKNALILGAGSNSKHDAVILLAGVKDAVCKEINAQLNGAALTDTIPTFGPVQDYAGFIAGASATDPNTSVQLDFSQAAGTNALNWSNGGCIRGANFYDGNNVFYRVLASDID
ncbi:hypothetical protein LPN04_10415 [Rugamonas sp. A1-17]|nr:hypothetical protein [Rugamonas sp. A1-17]